MGRGRKKRPRPYLAARSLLDSSTLALRNARKTLGKERDCSQSVAWVKISNNSYSTQVRLS